MKILITGGSGFIGKSLVKALNQEHDVFSPSSKELDITNSYDVEKYLQNKYFDWVIHCAIKGGRRATEDTSDDAYNNIKMFFNLMNNKDRFGKLINFASGAEFDRNSAINSNTNNLNSSYGQCVEAANKTNLVQSIKGLPELIAKFTNELLEGNN